MNTLSAFVGQHFAFASGRTAILKQHLLSQSDVDRLLGSHSLTEFERTLGELKLMEGVKASAIEAMARLDAVERWMKQEVELMTPVAKRPIFGVLWLMGDAPRLAYLLKKFHKLASEVSNEPVTSLSMWDPDALRSTIEGTTASALLPKTLLAFIASMKKLTRPSPWTIDRRVAQFIAERRTALATAHGSADIVRYVRHSIDITNIRTALRLTDVIAPDRADAFLSGGFIPRQRYIDRATRIHSVIAVSDLYAPFITTKGNVAPVTIEKIGAEILADDIGRMWTVPLTVEPIFAFAAMVIAHVRLLRAIAIGKRNALSPQDIKQILPPFIPASRFSA